MRGWRIRRDVCLASRIVEFTMIFCPFLFVRNHDEGASYYKSTKKKIFEYSFRKPSWILNLDDNFRTIDTGERGEKTPTHLSVFYSREERGGDR